MIITSKDNPSFVKYKKLKRKKYRKKYGLFLAEGYKLVKEAMASPYQIEDIVVSESSPYLEEFSDGFIVTDKLFKDLSSMEEPEGVLAVVRKRDQSDDDLADRVILLDGIKDPGNLGTLIRSAAAFGFKNILMMKGTTGLYNEKTIRASMGAIFRVNSTYIDKEAVLKLKDQGYSILSSSLEGASYIEDMELVGRSILVIGSESHGISDFFKEISDDFIKIRISKDIDSLNAAIAGSILMYEYSPLRSKIGK